jgi:hypothetical protein
VLIARRGHLEKPRGCNGLWSVMRDHGGSGRLKKRTRLVLLALVLALVLETLIVRYPW